MAIRTTPAALRPHSHSPNSGDSRPDPNVDIEVTMDALKKHVEAGDIGGSRRSLASVSVASKQLE